MTTIAEWHAAREARIREYQQRYAGVLRDNPRPNMTALEASSQAGLLGGELRRRRAKALVPAARAIMEAAVRVSGFSLPEMVARKSMVYEPGRSSPITWRVAAFTICRNKGIPWLAIAEAMDMLDRARRLMSMGGGRSSEKHWRHHEFADMMCEIREEAKR